MMEFTPTAFRLIRVCSLEEAKRLGHKDVVPEHIFLALLREGAGTSARVLRNLKVDFSRVRKVLEESLSTWKTSDTSNGLPFFSQKLDAVFDRANQEAENMGHVYIGTEHILIALYATQNTIQEILIEEGIDIPALRREVINVTAAQKEEIAGEKAFSAQYPAGNGSSKQQKASSFYKTPLLDAFSQDLTMLARTRKLDPLIGRKKETERIIQILSRRHKNNVVIIGEPGVGKTAIVEGLATAIEEGNVPPVLYKKRLLVIDLLGIVAGTKYRGEFEDRLRKIIKEVKKAKNTILFIDEFHTIVGAGAAEGTMDAANILKPELARGELQVIGATTISEYRKYIEKDAALTRRFQPLILREPDEKEAVEILEGLQERYENFHHVHFTKAALRAAVKYALLYLNRPLPDGAIDIMDETGARVNIRHSRAPEEITKMRGKMEEIQIEKEMAVLEDDFEKAAQYRDEVREIQEVMDRFQENWRDYPGYKTISITERDIAETVSLMTEIPIHRLTRDYVRKILNLEEDLSKEIIGQPKAVQIIARAMQRSAAGLHYSNRPMGSFLFMGSTGVGKTQLAKSLAKSLFVRKESFKRLDMSDFMERHTVSRLIGSPPGYVGFEEGGALTEFVRKNPYSLILFDEIEKAHADVFNILLQVLEEGELSDNLGNRVSFRHTVIILTSNLGSSIKMDDKEKLGFLPEAIQEKEGDDRTYERESLKKIKNFFRPEFINRLDSIVMFDALSEESLLGILELMLDRLKETLKEQKIILSFADSVKRFLVSKGFDKKYGARSLRRAVTQYLETPLSLQILDWKKDKPRRKIEEIHADVQSEQIVWSITANDAK